MEVCGGHTHTIFKYGIEDLLPPNITMIHGPGCPVCVLPIGRVDDAISIAVKPEVSFTTSATRCGFPVTKTIFLESKAGGDIRMVYSPLDSLKIAKMNPDKQVVFFGLGFETTSPSTAMTILQAEKEDVKNFTIFCHTFSCSRGRSSDGFADLPLERFSRRRSRLFDDGLRGISAFTEKDKPLVVSGFEPLDILQSLYDCQPNRSGRTKSKTITGASSLAKAIVKPWKHFPKFLCCVFGADSARSRTAEGN